MSCVDQELLLDIFREENLEGVRYHQDGVVLKGNAQDDKRNFTGSLILMQRSVWNKTIPGHRICYLVWIPYSYLFCLAPHLVSPAVRRFIDANGDLPLLDRRDAAAHVSTKIEWMYTMCLPLTRIAKLQRKSNLRGKRIVTIYRVGGGVECPLIFQDGGMTKLFDDLKKVCTVRQVPNSVDEFAIEDRSGDAFDEVDGPGAPPPSSTQQANTRLPSGSAHVGAPQTAVAGKQRRLLSGDDDAYVDPLVLREELYAERPTASAAGPFSPQQQQRHGSASVTPTSGSLGSDISTTSSGGSLNQTIVPAGSANNKKSVMRSLLSFGANLTQRGSKIADTVMQSVSTVADDLVGEASSDFDVVEAVAEVEDMVPRIAHLTQRKSMKDKLSKSEWDASFSPKDRRIDPITFQKLREKAFYGGIEDAVRAEVWSYLLALYPVGSTAAEREAIDSSIRREYETMKLQWLSMSSEQEKRHAGYRERKSAIDKDVVRTDRFLPEFAADDAVKLRQLHDCLMTYAMYNYDLGYCQGMSDILAVLALMYHEEWKIFAMFRQMMSEKCEGNFRSDVKQNMEKQLLAVETLVRRFAPALYQHLERHHAHGMTFCFRWLLILFKREFSLSETMLLWDVLLTSPHTPQFEVFVTAALLRALSGQVVEQSLTYDELLKFANGLAGNVAVRDVIVLAQEFYDVVASHVVWKERLGATATTNGTGASQQTPRKPTLDEVLAVLKSDSPPASPSTKR